MTSSNFSLEPSARPPEMMILAEVSSGRSLFRQAVLDEGRDRPLSAAAVTVSTLAEPPSPAAWKEAVRTVMTFLASVDCTVWIALPA
jgi:hypothetical protein